MTLFSVLFTLFTLFVLLFINGNKKIQAADKTNLKTESK